MTDDEILKKANRIEIMAALRAVLTEPELARAGPSRERK